MSKKDDLVRTIRCLEGRIYDLELTADPGYVKRKVESLEAEIKRLEGEIQYWADQERMNWVEKEVERLTQLAEKNRKEVEMIGKKNGGGKVKVVVKKEVKVSETVMNMLGLIKMMGSPEMFRQACEKAGVSRDDVK